MLPSFIITLRETLEAALIIGIVLSYLGKTGNTRYNKVVWAAVGVAIAASIAGAYLFDHFAGGFTGRAEEIFEGIVMLVGAALLTTMIFWMMKRQAHAERLTEAVEEEVSHKQVYGLFSLVCVSVLREGIETVVFLQAASIITGSHSLTGAILGIVVASILGYLIFAGARKVNIKKFFRYTSILLILFAAGLTAHGIHELQEAGLVPIVIEHVWDINPSVTEEGVYPLLHEKGYIGSVLAGLFGYNGNPSLIEVLSYLLYIALAGFLWHQIGTPKKQEQTSV